MKTSACGVGRLTGLAAWAALVVLASACGAKDDASVASRETASAAAPGSRSRTPAMGKPWDQINRVEFNAYLELVKLDSSGTVGQRDVARDCEPGSGASCQAQGATTTVSIFPSTGATELKPGELDPTGHVIAVLKNTGGGKEKTFGLPPNSEVYWLVDNNGSRFVHLRGNGLQEVGTGTFEPCGHEEKALDAAFATCEESAQLKKRGPSGPSWVSCLAGCCISVSATTK